MVGWLVGVCLRIRVRLCACTLFDCGKLAVVVVPSVATLVIALFFHPVSFFLQADAISAYEAKRNVEAPWTYNLA